MLRNSVINIILKTGLSLSLLYAALASVFAPAIVVSRWPFIISNQVSEGTLSFFTGLACLVCIAWLFSGKKKFAATMTVTVALALTGLFNILSVSFLFSIAPLFFIALALSIRYYPRVRIVSETMITPLHPINPLHEGTLPDEREENNFAQ